MMGLLPHELRDLLSDIDAIAEFLDTFLIGTDPAELKDTCWMVVDPNGNPMPFEEVENFRKWESSLQRIKQAILNK